MKNVFQPEWRTQNRRKRRFYSKYMRWLEVFGYLTVAFVVGAFVLAFNYKVDDVIEAQEVKLMPLSTPHKQPISGMVVKVLAAPWAEVKAGQPIMEVVTGEASLAAYQKWLAMDSLKGEPGAEKLIASIKKPETQVILAPASGSLEIKIGNGAFEAGSDLFAILDYGSIVLDASLSGASVAKASVGQTAQISALTLSGSPTLFRGTTPDGPILSSSVISEKALVAVNESLEGRPLSLRDDKLLQIESVTKFEVDAHAGVEGRTPGQEGIALEPPTNYSITAKVVEGTHTGSVQLADLPTDVRSTIESAITSSVSGTPLVTMDGREITLGMMSQMNVVLKVKAKSTDGGSSTGAIRGTPLKRTYDAKLRIDSPPPFLVNLLKAAHQNGKDLTARVALKTSTRPLAFILLKRS